MFFTLSSICWCNIRNEEISDQFCSSCKRHISRSNYTDVYVVADKLLHAMDRPNAKSLDYWPMSLRSFRSILLHEKVVKELVENNITGAIFHKILRIEGKILDHLPPPPDYYMIEPLNFFDFDPSLEEFEILKCGCGAQQKMFGDYKKPFQLKENSWDGSDIFSINNVNYSSWICVSRNVVDVLLKNEWKSQFWFGSRAFPGITIKDFSDTWYEDTLGQLRIKFPDLNLSE